MLEPGTKYRWSRAITEQDVRRFTELSGDAGRHHVQRDEKGRLQAHGLLTATLPTKLGGDLDYMARTMRFEFLKPVWSGDTLECEGTVLSVGKQTSRWKVRFAFSVRNQHGEEVLRGDTAGMIFARIGP